MLSRSFSSRFARLAIVALMACALVPSKSQAAAINFQLGSGADQNTSPTAPLYIGTGASALLVNGGTPNYHDSGTVWNEVGANGGTATKDSHGNVLASGPTLSVSHDFIYSNGSGIVLMDYWDISRTSTGIPFSLSNVPNGTYDLYLYGANGAFNDGRGTTFSVSGAGTLSDITTNATHGDQSFVNGDNYVVFQSVSVHGPGGFGSINGTYTWNAAAPNTGEGNFNGLQLVKVPEPSTFILGSLGVIGLLVAARRRQI